MPKKRMKKKKADKTLSSTKSRIELLSRDVTMNIFSRLPVKSLGKSKCVCKEWRNVISNPIFKSLHRELCLQNPNILLINKTGGHGSGYTVIRMSSIDFDGNLNFVRTFTVDAYHVELLPSKGELICFVTSRGFHVCNPSTGEMVNLPKAGQVFCSAFGSAFGYVKERNEYVLFTCYVDSGEIRCEVWTDGCCLTGHSSKVFYVKCPYLLDWDAVLVGNCFYWIEQCENEVIVSFDLVIEKFGTMVPPQGAPLDSNKVQFLVELKGMLCLADSPEDKSTMDIWVLKDFMNDIWVKEYAIDLSIFDLSNSNWFSKIIPLYHREGKILMDVKLKSLEWYDVENKCVNRIQNNEISQGLNWIGLYTDGLFSLV